MNGKPNFSMALISLDLFEFVQKEQFEYLLLVMFASQLAYLVIVQ